MHENGALLVEGNENAILSDLSSAEHSITIMLVEMICLYRVFAT